MRRSLVAWVRLGFGYSERQACGLMGICRPSLRYKHRRDPQLPLRMRLKELAATRVRFGYRRLTVLLRREGWMVNTKRVYRIYKEEGLMIRKNQIYIFKCTRINARRSCYHSVIKTGFMNWAYENPHGTNPRGFFMVLPGKHEVRL